MAASPFTQRRGTDNVFRREPAQTGARTYADPVSLARGGGGVGSSVALSAPRATVAPPTPSPSPQPDPDAIKEQQDSVESPPKQGWWDRIFGAGSKELLPGLDKSDFSTGIGDGATGLPYAANQDVLQGERAQEKRDVRSNYQAGFTPDSLMSVRSATEDEWGSLTDDQKRGAYANFMLYQAAEADKALKEQVDPSDTQYQRRVESIFGSEGGSDIYAPNTIRVLEELGYENHNSDLDLFLDGSAIASAEEVLGAATADPNSLTGAAQVFADLMALPTLQSEEVASSMKKGADLLESLYTTNTLSPEVLQFAEYDDPYVPPTIPEERLNDLDKLLDALSRKDIWNDIQQDPALNEEFQEYISTTLDGLDISEVTQYFQDRYRSYNGDPAYMNLEEFSQNWLE